MKFQHACIGLLALFGSHCGGGAGATTRSARESTSGSENSAPSAPPPLPAPVEGTFKLPIKVPHELIAALLDSQVPTHQAEGFQPLTRPGSSPELHGAYEIWRDPVRVSFADSTLHLEVPLRYAGRFNARIKNPFGGNWLTVARNEPWGTKEHPLRVTVRLHSKISVSPTWQLSLTTTVDPPEHGPPPDGKICTGGAFKLCTSKSTVAPHVQRRIDAEVRARLGKAAADFDRVAPTQIALPARVQNIYRELVQPKSSEHGRFMTLTPRRAALTLRGAPDAVIIEPALFALLAYHEGQPQASAPALPPRSAASDLPERPLALPAQFIPPELQLLLQNP